MSAAGGRALSRRRSAVWPDRSKWPGEDNAAKDVGESKPPCPDSHLHPTCGAGSGGRRDDGAPERPAERHAEGGAPERGEEAERSHR